MKEQFKKYKFSIATLVLFIAAITIMPDLRPGMVLNLRRNFKEMLSVMPAVFILLGLLDVWVEKQTMMKYMGENSGIFGSLLTFIMATAAAGPLYVAFPIVVMLLKKGVKLFNVFLFLGVWASAKIPFLLFETANLGFRYMATRFIGNITGIIIMSYLLARTTSEDEKNKILEAA